MKEVRGHIVTPDGIRYDGVVRFEDGIIVDVDGTDHVRRTVGENDGLSADAANGSNGSNTSDGSNSSNGANTSDGSNEGWIVPGFIDMHVHGGNGADFMDATPQAARAIAAFHGRHGTTSMLATTLTAPKPDIDRAMAAVAQAIAEDDGTGARLLGVHLEGPFLSPRWPGAQNPAYIVPPDQEWVEDWLTAYPGLLKQLTLAPEAEGAAPLIERLAREGVVVAAGHTDASYEQVVHAADKGLRQAVHTFNAMTGLHHRKPGTAGAVLTDDRICAEVIADGHHVHPGAIKLLTKTKTANNLILITDAVAAAGLGDGSYTLGGLEVTVANGVATLTHGNSLAGSTLTMIEAFRFMVRRVGLTVPEASALASANAARQLGLAARIGAIRPGMAADFVLLTPGLDIRAVYRDGRPIG